MVTISSSKQAMKTRNITRRRLLPCVAMSRWSLPLILLFQALLSVVLLRNTAFQDEALYLFAGQDIVHGWLHLPNFPVQWTYFLSGYAYFYPVIGGALAMLGGVELARMFSLLGVLVANLCVYSMTQYFFDRNSALLASILFAFQAPVLFIGRLATYDSSCLGLIALSVILALHASKVRRPWAILGIGPLLVLAILAKFAGLLFVPLPLAMLAWCSLQKQGWLKTLLRLGLALFSLVVTCIVTYIIIDKGALHAISASTTSRDVIVKTAPLFLIQYIITLSGPTFALGLLGLALGGRRHLLTGLLLLGSSLLVPAYHIYEGELISLHKHLAFSMFFVMPLAGYAVAHIGGYQHKLSLGRHWLAGLAICLMLFSTGIGQAETLYGAWASSTNLVSAMLTQVRLASGRYLAEDFDVCRYYLQDETALWQWSSLDFFEYTDKEGHYLVGREAYHAAIHEGYFAIVELSYGYNAALAVFIGQELAASGKYQLIAKIPNSNSYGKGYFWIWRKL